MMLKQHIEQKLRHALAELFPQLTPQQAGKATKVERSDPRHGDYATNAAMALAKPLRTKPIAIAEQLRDCMQADECIEQVSVAPPGFLNFRVRHEAIMKQCANIPDNNSYGRSDHGDGKRVLLEYVSANPTGPLHIGHGRGAAFGDILARLLRNCGYDVETEYYLNDAGYQIDTLGACIWLRHLQRSGFADCGKYPSKGYQGDYINDIAGELLHLGQDAWPAKGSWPDAPADDDAYLNALVALARQQPHYETFRQKGLEVISADIREELDSFAASPQNWFSERGLYADGDVERCLKLLGDNGHTEKRDGAVWFLSSKFGDEKDRVLVRENGQETYFLADIAYHLNKYQRGYDLILNIWGADHHGYVPRLKAAMSACGQEQDRLEIILLQFVALRNAESQTAMSTRAGQYVSLRQLRQTAGHDATRFFYVTRKGEQHLDFDVRLAQSKSNDNPVYYVQYAHARICSVIRNADDKLSGWKDTERSAMTKLNLPAERLMAMELLSFPDVALESALRREPHRLTYYLRDLAALFHSYYNETTILGTDREQSGARLLLISAVRTVIKNGLKLLAVTAPDEM